MNLWKTRLALDDFILEMMRTPPWDLKLEQLQNWVARLDLKDDLFRQYISFCDQRYLRKLICRTSRFDMLVLCWQPGQVSTIHDHTDSLNVTRVYSGSPTSRLFEVHSQPGLSDCAGRTLRASRRRSEALRALQLKREEYLKKDDLALVERNEIHQLANTSAQKLVTLHVYARPLLDITVYCPDSGKSERVPVQCGLEEDFA